MKAILLAFFALAASAMAQTDFQAIAVKKYPDLAKDGSALNKKFLALVAEKRKSQPRFFENADWPLRIAREADAAIPKIEIELGVISEEKLPAVLGGREFIYRFHLRNAGGAAFDGRVRIFVCTQEGKRVESDAFTGTIAAGKYGSVWVESFVPPAVQQKGGIAKYDFSIEGNITTSGSGLIDKPAK